MSLSIVRVVLALGLAVGVVRYVAELVATLTTDARLYDFSAYLQAAERIVAGEALYPGSYLYPPTLALLLTPFAALTPLAAQRIWVVLDQFFLWAGIWISLRLLPRPLTTTERLLFGCVVLSFYPVYIELKLGQVGTLLFFLMAAMALLWRNGRRLPAASLVAFAGTLKFYPLGFALWFLRQRAYAAAITVIAGFAAILIVPEIVFGSGWLSSYIASMDSLVRSQGSPQQPRNQSLFGFVGRLSFAFGDGVLGTGGFAIAAGVGAAAFLLSLTHIERGERRGDVIALGVTAAALPLAWSSPFNWSHNFFVILLAVAPLLQRFGERLQSPSAADRAALGAVMLAWLFLSQPYRLQRLLGYGEHDTMALAMVLRAIQLYGSVLIWAVLLRELRSSRTAALAARNGASRRSQCVAGSQ